MNTKVIILAAGQSSRMGRHKALLTFAGRTFIEHLAELFVDYVDEIILVVSPQLDLILRDLSLSLPKTHIIVNPSPQYGRFSSIHLGLRAAGIRPVFLHNVDSPLISRKTLEVLLNHYSASLTLIPEYKLRHGHPILIGEHNVQLMLEYELTANFKQIVRSLPFKYIQTNDPNILLNINTPEDFSKLVNIFSKKSDNFITNL